MRKHQKTKVCFLLQSEELLSDERAPEDRSLFFYYSLKSCCLMREYQKTEVYFFITV